jgi:hypothetical protein
MASQHSSSLLIDGAASATAWMWILIRFRSPWNLLGRCCHRASIGFEHPGGAPAHGHGLAAGKPPASVEGRRAGLASRASAP